jgi:hypothetical protein
MFEGRITDDPYNNEFYFYFNRKILNILNFGFYFNQSILNLNF